MEPLCKDGWASSHAAVPFVADRGDKLDLFFSSRDEGGRSHTVRMGFDLSSGRAELGRKCEPVLSPGPLGGFDDSGAMGACLVSHQGREYLYYIGWSLGVTVPFTTYIGLAIKEEEEQVLKERHVLQWWAVQMPIHSWPRPRLC